MTSTELRQQVAAAIAEAEQIHQNPAGDNGDLTAEQSERYAALMADAKRLKADAVKAERGEMLAQEQAELRAAKPLMAAAPTIITRRDAERDRKEAMRAWALMGTKYARNDADTLYRAAESGINLYGSALDYRALSKGTNSAGGYTVPQGFASEVEKKLKWYCQFREFCKVLPTADGIDYPMPVVDNTSNTGAIVAENGANAVTGADPTFSQVVLKSFFFRTPVVKVSQELLFDSITDVESLLADLLVEHLGREMSLQMATGDGTTEPEAITSGVSVGVNLASGNAITLAKLIDLQHSVDRAYRDAPGCGWLMHDATLAEIRKLATTTGEPLFNVDVSGNAPGTLLGKPYYVCNDLTSYASPGDNAPLMLFGNFQKYIIRTIPTSAQLVRYNELYRANGQIGFQYEERGDARWINKGAVKSLNSYDSP